MHRQILAPLQNVRSTAELVQNPHYVSNIDFVKKTLGSCETFTPLSSPSLVERNFIRVAAWNIERGIAFDGILKAIRNHHILSTCDILLLTEVDVGMARTRNRHIALELGEALGFHTAFGPAYINLDKGNGFEIKIAEGENTLALQGHAILSRFPLSRVGIIAMPNTEDHMAGKERQIGSEQAIVATVETPLGEINVVSTHLSLRSSRSQRVTQMDAILKGLSERAGPILIGGDWNTTTYNSHRASSTIIGFWVRVMMGIYNVVLNHYPYPNRFFEKKLFATLKRHGFDTEGFNFPGGCTVHYSVNHPQVFQSLGDWIPEWCFKFIRWALRETDGICSFKLDWFAAKNLKGTNPTVIYDLPRGYDRLSDHDPIVIDVVPA